MGTFTDILNGSTGWVGKEIHNEVVPNNGRARPAKGRLKLGVRVASY